MEVKKDPWSVMKTLSKERFTGDVYRTKASSLKNAGIRTDERTIALGTRPESERSVLIRTIWLAHLIGYPWGAVPLVQIKHFLHHREFLAWFQAWHRFEQQGHFRLPFEVG